MTAERIVSIDSGVVIRGREAWEQEKTSTQASRERWRLIGEALLIGRRLHARNEAFGAWCRAEGFGDMDRRDRSDAMWLAEHLVNVVESSTTHRHPHAIRKAHRDATTAKESPPVKAEREQSTAPPQAPPLRAAGSNDPPAPVSPGANAHEVAIQERIAAAIKAAEVRWVMTGQRIVSGAATTTYTEKERNALIASYRKQNDRLQRLTVIVIHHEVEAMIAAAMHRERARLAAEKLAIDEAQAEAFYAELEKRLTQALERLAGGQAGVASWMTLDEFKRVLSCLHPDREVDDKRKNEAFGIFNRLKASVDPRTAIDYLREKGWERFSSRYKPPREAAS